MIEEVAERLIAALNANTIAHGGTAPGGKAAPGKVTPGKAVTAPKEDKITFEMVKAALVGVKDEKGKPAAVKIIKEAGNSAEMNGIKPARYSAVIAACEEIMGEAAEDPEDDDSLC